MLDISIRKRTTTAQSPSPAGFQAGCEKGFKQGLSLELKSMGTAAGLATTAAPCQERRSLAGRGLLTQDRDSHSDLASPYSDALDVPNAAYFPFRRVKTVVKRLLQCGLRTMADSSMRNIDICPRAKVLRNAALVLYEVSKIPTLPK